MDARNTDKVRDIFVVGLRNAHAMENEALGHHEAAAEALRKLTRGGQRLEAYIRETEGQLERLRAILNDMGESSSTLKDTALSVTGSMAAMGHTLAGDEIVKNSFANSPSRISRLQPTTPCSFSQKRALRYLSAAGEDAKI